MPALLALVEPDQRGDPESPLLWTTKSTRRLAAQLTADGHPVGADTVAALLQAEGFSLQGTSRTEEGTGGLRSHRRSSGDRVSLPAGNLEMEPDRAPVVLPDQHELARTVELHPVVTATSPPATAGRPRPARQPRPGLAASSDHRRHAGPPRRGPARLRRAVHPRPPTDQPAPQARPLPRPATRTALAVRPPAGHRDPPPLENPARRAGRFRARHAEAGSVLVDPDGGRVHRPGTSPPHPASRLQESSPPAGHRRRLRPTTAGPHPRPTTATTRDMARTRRSAGRARGTSPPHPSPAPAPARTIYRIRPRHDGEPHRQITTRHTP
ncbi:Rhodopirellula transposase [Frankia sp. QA3]|nr:Rhodopirellula transposase [Frankia sp. QA3]